MKEYKFSYYNEIFTVDKKVYIYNYITGGLGELDEQAVKLYKKCNDKGMFLKGILDTPSLKEELIKGGMLIDKEMDEFEYLKYLHYSGRYADSNCFTLTLLPTNACNCRCPYCFEREYNYKKGMMSEEIQKKVINLIDENLKENGKLDLTWFGGEPLLGFDVIENFYKEIENLKKEKNLYIHSGMVTNGVLLTNRISRKLLEFGIEKIQITLDGSKRIHNSKRKLHTGEGTFGVIINNLKEADKNLKIMLRVNVDKKNTDYMEELLDELISYGVHDMENISLYFGMIRDYSLNGYKENIFYSSEEYAAIEIMLNKMAQNKGFNLELFPHENIVNCGSIFPNTLVVEADGTLQKCWNTVGDKSKSIGNILEAESEIINTNLMKWLGWNPLKKEKCISCKKLLLCFGGCPYFGIYKSDPNYMYECNPVALNSLERIRMIVDTVQDKEEVGI